MSSVGDKSSSCPQKVCAALQYIVILVIVLEMCHLRGRMQVEVMHYLAAELPFDLPLHFDDF